MAENPIAVVATVLTIAIALLIGIAVTDTIGQQTDTTPSAVSEIQPLDGTTWVNVDSAYGDNETVYQSRGNAVKLNGADDSYVKSNADVQIATDGNWTVCTWARVGNSSASMTALSVDGRVVLGYNGTAGNWTGWYYDDGSRSSWNLTADATNESRDLHQLCMVRDDPALRFYVNATREDSVPDTSASNVASAPVSSTNWNGTLEETRTFDDALTASQRNATVNQPNDPLTNATRTARMMYDAGAGRTVHIWWSNADATLSNGTWVSGFAGEEMQRAGIISDNDYRWRNEGPQIKPSAGGELDGAPVAYVDYDKASTSARVMNDIAGAYDLAGVIMIVLLAGVILGIVQRFR